MWILDQAASCVYNADTCREISLIDNFEIGMANGVGVKEKNYYALGFYSNRQRIREVFNALIQAISLEKSIIYKMPKE